MTTDERDRAKLNELMAVCGGAKPMAVGGMAQALAGLREKLVAELETLKPRSDKLWEAYLEAKDAADKRMNEWSPVYSRSAELERQIATLDKLAEQLETKSPGGETGAQNTTAERTQP